VRRRRIEESQKEDEYELASAEEEGKANTGRNIKIILTKWTRKNWRGRSELGMRI